MLNVLPTVLDWDKEVYRCMSPERRRPSAHDGVQLHIL